MLWSFVGLLCCFVNHIISTSGFVRVLRCNLLDNLFVHTWTHTHSHTTHKCTKSHKTKRKVRNRLYHWSTTNSSLYVVFPSLCIFMAVLAFFTSLPFLSLSSSLRFFIPSVLSYNYLLALVWFVFSSSKFTKNKINIKIIQEAEESNQWQPIVTENNHHHTTQSSFATFCILSMRRTLFW